VGEDVVEDHVALPHDAVNATSRRGASRGAPPSIALRRRAMPLGRSGAASPTTNAGRRQQTTREPAALPREHRAHARHRLLERSDAAAQPWAPRRAHVRGSIWATVTPAAVTAATIDVPSSASSSSRRAVNDPRPLDPEAPEHLRHRLDATSLGDTSTCRRTPAGLASGPRR